MAEYVVLEGAEDLDRKLKALETKVGKYVVRKAVRAGQKVLLAAAKVYARSVVGGTMGALLARNIVLRAPRRQRRETYSLQVRLKGASEGAPPEFIHVTKRTAVSKRGTTYRVRHFVPAAIEYGHGSNKGACAMPFMRGPAKATKDTVLGTMTNNLAKGIEAVAITGTDSGQPEGTGSD